MQPDRLISSLTRRLADSAARVGVLITDQGEQIPTFDLARGLLIVEAAAESVDDLFDEFQGLTPEMGLEKRCV